MPLSDNALLLWTAHFLTPGNTLRFGGDHAEMEITEDARTALNELILCGAVEAIKPDDQWPNREHFGATTMDLRETIIQHCGEQTPFEWATSSRLITFRKKHSNSQSRSIPTDANTGGRNVVLTMPRPEAKDPAR